MIANILQGVPAKVIFSCMLIAACTYTFVYIRKLIRKEPGTPRSKKIKIFMLGFGIAIVAAMLVVPIWQKEFTAVDNLYEWLSNNQVYGNLFKSILTGVVLLVVVRGANHAILNSDAEIPTKHKLRRAVSWTGLFVFLFLLFITWAHRLTNVGVFLGIIGAGLALSLQETILCIAGWLLIVLQKPFDVGDRIEVNGQTGDVIDIRMFHSTLLEVGNWVHADQSTGRIIHVPNRVIFRNEIFNYSRGFAFIWNEIETVVTFESNWERAKKLLLSQAEDEVEKIKSEVEPQLKNMQNQYAIFYPILTPIVYTSIAAHGVKLTLRYLTPVKKRRTTLHKISEGLLAAFRGEKDIDFAYPTTRFYSNPAEGKEPLRPSQPPKDA